MKFAFGDIVVVENNLIGVVVKCWEAVDGFICDVYVRVFRGVKPYREDCVERYMVRHKYLNDEELTFQANALKTFQKEVPF